MPSNRLVERARLGEGHQLLLSEVGPRREVLGAREGMLGARLLDAATCFLTESADQAETETDPRRT
jgi:hypothetical protein